MKKIILAALAAATITGSANAGYQDHIGRNDDVWTHACDTFVYILDWAQLNPCWKVLTIMPRHQAELQLKDFWAYTPGSEHNLPEGFTHGQVDDWTF